jgi:hypothetical protein
LLSPLHLTLGRGCLIGPHHRQGLQHAGFCSAAARIVDHNVLAGTKQQCSQIPYRKLSRLHGKDAGIAFLHDIRSRIPAIERRAKKLTSSA